MSWIKLLDEEERLREDFAFPEEKPVEYCLFPIEEKRKGNCNNCIETKCPEKLCKRGEFDE